MDGIGNPVGLLTDFATNAFSFSYDPYGAANLTAGGTGNGYSQNPYLFKAGIQDRAAGFVKFGLRWYNPTTGTWTQQDTLDAPLDPANANRYAFTGCDPVNGSDPSGRDCASSILVNGIAFVGGVAGLFIPGADLFAAVDLGLSAVGALTTLAECTDNNGGTSPYVN